ncbi:MAG: hypothetical protein CBE41_02310 [Gammaproteobacteria bacterium TMED281]|nr:MAG: hypothetical protein CBE41_02310 [Gammaproteobacteria bacterium TMED281]|tara:strand:- start:854 stop:2365 length:1512 start_codon:yes stop_codon:yes gene_type:complete
MTKRDVKNIGVIGCGVMGQGIIQTLVTTEHSVFIYDVSQEMVTKSISQITNRIDRLVEKETISRQAADKAIKSINIAETLGDLSKCSVIIEAVYENLDLKINIINQLEEFISDDVIIASNTSSLLIASIASQCRLPNRVAGLHFFNPVPLMKLVEVVAGPATSNKTVEVLKSLSSGMGKLPVQVKDAPGFLVNFGGRAYTTEAMRLLHERIATPSQIDYIMRLHAGFMMGPLELADLTGVDVNYPVTQLIYNGYNQDPRIKTSFPHMQLFEAARFGRKTNHGSYIYDKNGLKKDINPIYVPATETIPLTTVITDKTFQILSKYLLNKGFSVLEHDDGQSPIIAELYGEDCSAYIERTGCDYKRLIAVDMLFKDEESITLMTPPGRSQTHLDGFVRALMQQDIKAILIKDSPGFIAQRITAMIANLGCEMAQIGIAKPTDIDQAMRVGLNYPHGPIEWADKIGVKRCYNIMSSLQFITGDDRYRPSQWLRQRALLDLPIHTCDE